MPMQCVIHLRRPDAFLSSARLRHLSQNAAAIERLKNPSRGGQNLSLRYRTLEKSLRGKEALTKDIRTLEAEASPRDSSPQLDATRYFRGFEIPQRPNAPESDECCMSGCAVCVYDLYEESLAAYKESIAALTVSLSSAGIPEVEWPAAVRSTEKTGGGKPHIVLSAFEELEKALQERRGVRDDVDFIRNGDLRIPGKRAQSTWSFDDVYEGMRWLAFSRR
ncbi:oxidoreductase-like protein [Mycena sp. CBHHK59/15]|nr:oxidoreductase-like protein [Mycena sp. CBHHK59/15]